MRLALYLFCVTSMFVAAHTVRLDDCGRAYCVTQTVPLTNFTPHGISAWEESPWLGVSLNAFAEDVAIWFARYLPTPERSPEVTSDEPKLAKKPAVPSGDLSLASYVRGLRGLHSFEYSPVEVPTVAPEDLVIAPQQE
jgi:hypothetical protein